MTYNEYFPHPLLNPYVKCIWSLEIPAVPGPIHREKILPDGCVELIFNFGERFVHFGNDNLPDLQPQSFVYGQLKEYIEVGATGSTGIIAVRFYPYGLSAFINIPLSQLTQQYVCSADIFGKEAGELEDRLQHLSGGEDAVGLINAFLLRRLTFDADKLNRIKCVVDAITTGNGKHSIARLAADSCWSERQLERNFNAMVGMSPKMFMKITRFGNIASKLNSTSYDTLASLAYEFGYYDQAHFIRDFKAITGSTPLRHISEVNKMSDLFLTA